VLTNTHIEIRALLLRNISSSSLLSLPRIFDVKSKGGL